MTGKIARLKTIALIAFFSTMPIYSPNVVPLQQCLQRNEIMGGFVIPMMVSTAAMSAGLFVQATIPSSRFDRLLSACSSIAPFGYISCMAYFILASIGAAAACTASMTLCGVIVGICFPFVAIEWGKQLESFHLRQALLLVCVICASTATINWALSLLDSVPLAISSMILMTVGTLPLYVPSTVSLRIKKHSGKNPQQEGPSDQASRTTPETNSAGSGESQESSPLIPRFISVLVPGLIGLSVFAFHMGVSRELVLDSISTEILGNITASLILVPWCFIKSKQPTTVLLFSGIAPIAATMLLSFMAIANDFGAQNEFIATGIYTFFCLIAQISIALGIAGSHAREFSTSMIWSGFLSLFIAFSLLGLSLGSNLSGEQPLMPQAITAVYCAYLVTQAIRSLWKSGAIKHADERGANREKNVYACRCEELAASYSLSPREKEIASYLGRGHTCSYIAKTLVISESTVYTHSRNIYRKVGIQSKEELIQILATDSESS